jgi:hypothetical protein
MLRSNSSFVRDGHRRARRAIREEARLEIEEKYAEEWKASGIIKRWFLIRKIKREVRTHIATKADQAPNDALY